MNEEFSEIAKENLTIHEIYLKQEFLNWIRSGEKTAEIRIAFPRFQNIQVGDFVIFQSSSSSVKVKITAAEKYQTMDDVLQSEDTSKLAGNLTREEIQNLIPKIFADTEAIQKYGFVYFEFEVVK